jgi:DnaK suppressor protein
MAQYDEAAVRQRLTAERDRLRGIIEDMTHGNAEVLPVDPISDAGGLVSDEADDAGAMSDAERSQAVVRNSEALLAEVTAALERLDNGTYGTCARCGRPIDPRRLERLPYATLCIDDQRVADAQAAR